MLYTEKLLIELTNIVKGALVQFGLAPTLSVDLLTVSENATFTIGEPPRFIIRVYRPDYHTNAEIASELYWMKALEEQKVVNLPHLFTPRQGGLFLIQDQWRLACFEFINGHQPKANKGLIASFAKLGVVSAKLHKQAQTWQRPSHFIRKHWIYQTMIGDHAYWGNWRAAKGLNAAEQKILERCDQILKQKEQSFPHQREHFGLIHGDLRLANLIIDDQKIAAIDFDDCGFSWFGLDLANAISFIELDPIVPDLLAAWLDAYEAQQLSTKVIRALLPDLIMMRRLQLTAWLASHHETPTAKELGIAYNKGTVELGERFLSGIKFD